MRFLNNVFLVLQEEAMRALNKEGRSSVLEEAPKRNLRKKRGEKRRDFLNRNTDENFSNTESTSNTCSYDTDFKTGSSIHLGLGGCAGLCIHGQNGAAKMERCSSMDAHQKFTIEKASTAMGYYIRASGGGCLQPEDCNTSPSNLVVETCGHGHARWAQAGGGMLFPVGCFESGLGNAIGAISSGTTCTAGNVVQAVTTASTPQNVILFMSECAVRSI
jgi:hypothetical protein